MYKHLALFSNEGDNTLYTVSVGDRPTGFVPPCSDPSFAALHNFGVEKPLHYFVKPRSSLWSRFPPLTCLSLRLPPHWFDSYQHVGPSCRGSTLSPGDAPLLPGQCIEGAGGFHKLGWIPGLSWKPKLVISPDGDMIAQRHDGSEVRAQTVPAEGVPFRSFIPPPAVCLVF